MTIENVRGYGFARDEYGIVDLTGPLNRAVLADGSLARTGGYQHEDDEIQVLGLTAFIIIDSLGRKWNSLLHPRDRKGRFIETFAEIRAFLKGKGSTKADFTGRTVAMDPDGTAIVQVRGGRGRYASLRNQLVRVPMDKLETVDYKARIGQPAPRALDAPRRTRVGEVAQQTGQKFRPGSPTDELAQVERIAEAAEKAELPDIRDEMLEAKRYIRQEPSNDEVLDQAKALLPPQPERAQIPLGGVREPPKEPTDFPPLSDRERAELEQEYADAVADAKQRGKVYPELRDDMSDQDKAALILEMGRDLQKRSKLEQVVGRRMIDGARRLGLPEQIKKGDLPGYMRPKEDFDPERDQIGGGRRPRPVDDAGKRRRDDDTGVPASEPGGAEEGGPEGSRAVREDAERRGELPEPVARPAVAPPGGGGEPRTVPEEGPDRADEFFLPRGVDEEESAVYRVDIEAAEDAVKRAIEQAAEEAEELYRLELRKPKPGEVGVGQSAREKRDQAMDQLKRQARELEINLQDLKRAQLAYDRLKKRNQDFKKLGPPPEKPKVPVQPQRRDYPNQAGYDEAMRDYGIALQEFQVKQQQYEEYWDRRRFEANLKRDLDRAKANLLRAETRVSLGINRVQARRATLRNAVSSGQAKTVGEFFGMLFRAAASDLKYMFRGREKKKKKGDGDGDDDTDTPVVTYAATPEEATAALSNLSPDELNGVAIDPLPGGGVKITTGVIEPNMARVRGPVKNSPGARMLEVVEAVFTKLKQDGDNWRASQIANLYADLWAGDFDKFRNDWQMLRLGGGDVISPQIDAVFDDFSARAANDPDWARFGKDTKVAPPATQPADKILPDGWTELDPALWQSDLVDDAVEKLARTGPLADLINNGTPAERAQLIKSLRKSISGGGAPPKRVFQKGDITVVLDEEVPGEDVRTGVETFEKLLKNDPLDGSKVLRFTNLRDQLPGMTGVLGVTFLGSNIMQVDPWALRGVEGKSNVDKSHFMPAFYKSGLSPMEYTVTHEYGHMRGPVDEQEMFRTAMQAIQTVGQRKGLNAQEALAEINTYAKDGFDPGFDKNGNPLPPKGSEFFAEAYAEWVLSDGKTDNEYVQEWARILGLNPPNEGNTPESVGNVFDTPVAPPPANPTTEFFDQAALVRDPAVARQFAEKLAAERPEVKDAMQAAMDAALDPTGARADDRDKKLRAWSQYQKAIREVIDANPDWAAGMANLLRVLDPEFAEEDDLRRQRRELAVAQDSFDDYSADLALAFGLLPDRQAQENLAAFLNMSGVPSNEIDALLPDVADMDNDRIDRVANGIDLAKGLRDFGFATYGYNFAAGDEADAAEHFETMIRGALAQRNDDKNDPDIQKMDGFFQAMFARSALGDKDPTETKEPEPPPASAGGGGGGTQPPAPPAPPAGPPPTDSDSKRQKIVGRALKEWNERVRGRSQSGVKRGVGNIHLADRVARDKHGIPVRKGDVVWVPERDKRGAKGQWGRPQANGYVQNIALETEPDPDDPEPNPEKKRRRVKMFPVLDENGNQATDENGELLFEPRVKHIVFRHYSPKYIGGKHKWQGQRRLGIPWPFPYWDYEVDPSVAVRLNDDDKKAVDVMEKFGLHGRRMAGIAAGRFAPAIGRVFRLDRMAEIEPIQNRFLPDANEDLIGEGDIVRYENKLYEVLRPNNPWDNNESPRVMLRPIQGGKRRQVQADKVTYEDDPKNLVFFRGAGGVAAPTSKDLRRIMRERGVVDPDIEAALDAEDWPAVAKAINANIELAQFLDREAVQRADLRERMEAENKRGKKADGFIPVADAEYEEGQRDKYDAVLLLAAKRGFFGDDNGKLRRLDRKVQRDLYRDYEGAEKHVAMRNAYVDVEDALDEVRDAGPKRGTAGQEKRKMLGDVRREMANASVQTLKDQRERAQALKNLDEAEKILRADGENDAADKVKALREAIVDWGNEFDAVQGIGGPGGASFPEPGLPPAGTPPNAPGTPPATPPPNAPGGPPNTPSGPGPGGPPNAPGPGGPGGPRPSRGAGGDFSPSEIGLVERLPLNSPRAEDLRDKLLKGELTDDEANEFADILDAAADFQRGVGNNAMADRMNYVAEKLHNGGRNRQNQPEPSSKQSPAVGTDTQRWNDLFDMIENDPDMVDEDRRERLKKALSQAQRGEQIPYGEAQRAQAIATVLARRKRNRDPQGAAMYDDIAQRIEGVREPLPATPGGQQPPSSPPDLNQQAYDWVDANFGGSVILDPLRRERAKTFYMDIEQGFPQGDPVGAKLGALSNEEKVAVVRDLLRAAEADQQIVVNGPYQYLRDIDANEGIEAYAQRLVGGQQPQAPQGPPSAPTNPFEQANKLLENDSLDDAGKQRAGHFIQFIEVARQMLGNENGQKVLDAWAGLNDDEKRAFIKDAVKWASSPSNRNLGWTEYVNEIGLDNIAAYAKNPGAPAQAPQAPQAPRAPRPGGGGGKRRGGNRGVPKPDIDPLGIDSDDLDKVRGRMGIRARDALDKLRRDEKLSTSEREDLMDGLDRLFIRYGINGNAAERRRVQAVKNGAQRRFDQEDAREAAEITERGRTDAVENIYEQLDDVAAEARRDGQRDKAEGLDDAGLDLNDALDEARVAQEGDDKAARDAALDKADQVADAVEALGEKDMADRIRREIQGNRNRYAAEDNKPAPPAPKEEGRDKLANAVEQAKKDLRAEGAEGRRKLRDVLRQVNNFDEAIERAERAAQRGDDDERDVALQSAQDRIEEIRAASPDLADAMDEVLDGQEGRVLDIDPTQGDLFKDPGLDRRSGDPDFRDAADGDSPEAVRFREFAEKIRGLSLDEIRAKIQAGEIEGAKEIKRLNSKGLIGVQKITMDDGTVFVVKSDNEYEAGAPAEDVMARLAQGIGLRAPFVVMLNPDEPHRYDSPRGVLLMQFTQDLLRDDEQGIWDAEDVKKGKSGAPKIDIHDPSNYTEDGIRELLGLALLDTAGQNPDRHHGNYQMAVTKDGKLRPVVIDNGRSLHWSENYGGGRRSPSVMRDINSYHPKQAVQAWLQTLTPDEARAEMEKFLIRMRDYGEKMRALDPDSNDMIVERAEWALNNLDEVVRGWRR